MNHPELAPHIDAVDHQLLNTLEDVWIEHNDEDPREIDITFTFGENPYLTEKTLTKKFTVAPPEAGSSAELIKYDLDAPTATTPVNITWKDDEHNLVKKAPRVKIETLEEFDEFNGEWPTRRKHKRQPVLMFLSAKVLARSSTFSPRARTHMRLAKRSTTGGQTQSR
jgi:hypothetical protein